jgi:2-dehydropantoate 2-reductase
VKIGVVGCGAVGTFYGAQLCRAGHQVHFLLRSDYEAVRACGVQVLSPAGDFHATPRAARRPEEIGGCDLVVVALKTTANDCFPALVGPLVQPQTRVLTLQNGLGNEERLAALVGPDRVLGGLCFVCLNRIAPGVVRHTAHGDVLLGEHLHPPGRVMHEIARELQGAGIALTLRDNLAQARWEKLVWNIPFNGLGVAGVAGPEAVLAGAVAHVPANWQTLPTDRLLADARWERLLRELMDEVIAAANGQGFPVAATLADEMLQRTRCMGAYRASTLLDFERGLPLELDSLFREPLRRARNAGVRMPRLAALCAVLTALDRRAAWFGQGRFC